MKKLMFTLAAVAVALTSAQAQKQMGDEHNIEVSFNPFSGSPIDASVIKYRKFMDDDAALRVSLGLNNTANSYLVVPENSLQQLGAEGTITHPDLFLTNTSSSWSLSLGYEKHFRGTDNLSPYVALAVGVRMNSVDLTREHFSALNILDASAPVVWEGETDPANWGVWSYSNVVTSNQLNVDVLFGADYYFNDAIYVGFEAGLRFSNTAGISSTISTTDDNAFNIYFDGGSGSGGEHLWSTPCQTATTSGAAPRQLSTSSTVSHGSATVACQRTQSFLPSCVHRRDLWSDWVSSLLPLRTPGRLTT